MRGGIVDRHVALCVIRIEIADRPTELGVGDLGGSKSGTSGGPSSRELSPIAISRSSTGLFPANGLFSYPNYGRTTGELRANCLGRTKGELRRRARTEPVRTSNPNPYTDPSELRYRARTRTTARALLGQQDYTDRFRTTIFVKDGPLGIFS